MGGVDAMRIEKLCWALRDIPSLKDIFPSLSTQVPEDVKKLDVRNSSNKMLYSIERLKPFRAINEFDSNIKSFYNYITNYYNTDDTNYFCEKRKDLLTNKEKYFNQYKIFDIKYKDKEIENKDPSIKIINIENPSIKIINIKNPHSKLLNINLEIVGLTSAKSLNAYPRSVIAPGFDILQVGRNLRDMLGTSIYLIKFKIQEFFYLYGLYLSECNDIFIFKIIVSEIHLKNQKQITNQNAGKVYGLHDHTIVECISQELNEIDNIFSQWLHNLENGPIDDDS
jgi:hypothetical protein